MNIGAIMLVEDGDAQYIETTLRSLAAQIDELVIIDNATSDWSAKAIYRAQNMVDVRMINLNVPVSTARILNIGFHHLQPDIEWLFWFRPDQIFHPEFVGTLEHKILESREQTGLVLGGFTTFLEDQPSMQGVWSPDANNKEYAHSWDKSFLLRYDTMVEAGEIPDGRQPTDHLARIKTVIKRKNRVIIQHDESLVALRLQSR